MKKALADEILEKIRNVEPAFFERLVVELLVKMGYGGSMKDAGKAIGKSGDEGIDGTIKEDKLGLDIIYIQAKRWKDGNTVGRPEIQKFVGALAGQGAKKGIFITASSFTREALEYTPKNETKIIMLDGNQIANLMIEYNLGVSIQQAYEIKKLDSDYFGDYLAGLFEAPGCPTLAETPGPCEARSRSRFQIKSQHNKNLKGPGRS